MDVQRGLMDRGVAAFSLHFSGAWGSEGLYRFSTLVPQALCALKFLRKRPCVDSRRVGLFGFSMGGWAAINAAAMDPGIKAVAAVAPTGGPEMITPGMNESIEHLSRPLRVGSTKALARDFVRSVHAQDPARSAARLRVPLLLVHGERDEIIPAAVSLRILAASPGPKKLVLARGARHDFLDRRDWLAQLVAGWLKRVL